MCCDERQIYATGLVAKTGYADLPPTIYTGGAVTVGKFIHSTAIQVSCATLKTGGHGEVYGIHVVETETGTLQKEDLRFWIFNSAPITAVVQNTLRAFTNAEVLTLAGFIDIVAADYVDTSATTATVFKDLRNGTTIGSIVVPYNAVAASNTIYVAIEIRSATGTFDNASAIQFRLLLRKQ